MANSAPDFLRMLDALVSTPSVSSVSPAFDMGNRAVVDLIANWTEGLGFRVEVVALNEAGTKANLIATLGDGDGGFALAGHADTVPCDPQVWTHDPFRLTASEDKLYGLGTTDMKGFLALAVEAAGGLSAAELRHPLQIIVTADEESTMLGARELAGSGERRARYALIGEPTGLVPIRMHKGVAMEAITVTGRAGHSSDPRLGANAIEGMHTVIQEFLALRAELAQHQRNTNFDPPWPTMNLGHVHGGDNPNRICGLCELHYDIRLLPGLDAEQIRRTLEDRLARRLSGSEFRIALRALNEAVPAFETPADGPLVRAMEELTGQPARAAPFATEAPFFARLGIEAVVCGPGDLACAHQPDEFLARARIAPARDMLNKLIHRFCIAN